MSAKVLYVAKGTDAVAFTWPLAGPPSERFNFNSGQTTIITNMIGYGDGTITFPDGRLFPMLSSQGSTFVHQKG